MHIRTAFILICTICLISISCKNKNIKPGVEAFSSNFEYQFFDDLGKLKYIASYNKQLIMTQLSVFNENESLKYQIVKSHQPDFITEERLFDQSGSLENIAQYHYLPDGKLKKKEIISNANKLLLSCSYEYNNDGSLCKVDIYNADEKKKSVITYDKSLKAATHSVLSESGEILSEYSETSKDITFCEYIDKQMHKSTTYNKKDCICEESVFDDFGNLISMKKFDAANILEENLYNHGNLSQRNLYRYNKQGLQIEKLEFTGNNDKTQKRFIYSYDKNGHRIKMDVYNAKGEILEYLE